jgi:hypothetical protein
MSKQSEELRKQRMRKRARGIPRIPPSSSPGQLLKRMPQEHSDVLQNIEFMLAQNWREDPRVDDAVLDTALELALTASTDDQPIADSRVAHVLATLGGIRDMRADVPDDVWHDCLLTVRQSVRRHSSCRPGERGYLEFVSPFVP